MYMNPDDLQKAPKLFAENIKIGFTPEHFVLGVSTGSQAQAYALSPEHTKRLAQYLSHELKLYEEKHGEINAQWNPNIVSPVQRANPPSEGS